MLDWWANKKRDNWGLVENLVPVVREEIDPQFRRWGIVVVDIAFHTVVKCRTYRIIS